MPHQYPTEFRQRVLAARRGCQGRREQQDHPSHRPCPHDVGPEVPARSTRPAHNRILVTTRQLIALPAEDHAHQGDSRGVLIGLDLETG